MKDIAIEPSWKEILQEFFGTKMFKQLTDFVRTEYQSKTIYPKPSDIFKAFWLTPFSNVNVVILGQDPYHGPGQAHGLCFSVQDGIAPPPSLKNIYKEIEDDVGIKKDFAKGNLEHWATQGVFLLNAILSVEHGLPASHHNRGWEQFTDFVIKKISEEHEHVVFMLWGKYAQSKAELIDQSKHLVLQAPHPSPYSANSGFFGSKHFSKCNDYLKKHDVKPIGW